MFDTHEIGSRIRRASRRSACLAWVFTASIASADAGKVEALHLAIAANDEKAVTELIREDADIDGLYQGVSPVRRAIALGRQGMLALLVENGAPISPGDLLYAAEYGYGSAVEFFISQGIDVDSADPYEMTALHHAALNGREGVVGLLLSAGANVDAREVVQGYTPLILASAHGYANIVALLLEHGADIGLVTEDGYTALSWAFERSRPGSGHGRIIELLQVGN